MKNQIEIKQKIRDLKELHLDCKESGLKTSMKSIENKVDILEWVLGNKEDN